jgi:hypothetical protein
MIYTCNPAEYQSNAALLYYLVCSKRRSARWKGRISGKEKHLSSFAPLRISCGCLRMYTKQVLLPAWVRKILTVDRMLESSDGRGRLRTRNTSARCFRSVLQGRTSGRTIDRFQKLWLECMHVSRSFGDAYGRAKGAGEVTVGCFSRHDRVAACHHHALPIRVPKRFAD